MGRISKYDPDTFPARAKALALKGLSDKQIAHRLGINPRTLRRYRDRYQEFKEALKEGKMPVDREVENALLKRALGYETEETRTTVREGGNYGMMRQVERIKRFVPPDVNAQMFWLKNRQPERWRDKQEIKHSGTLADFLSRTGSLSDTEQKVVDEYYERYDTLGMRVSRN